MKIVYLTTFVARPCLCDYQMETFDRPTARSRTQPVARRAIRRLLSPLHHTPPALVVEPRGHVQCLYGVRGCVCRRGVLCILCVWLVARIRSSLHACNLHFAVFFRILIRVSFDISACTHMSFTNAHRNVGCGARKRGRAALHGLRFEMSALYTTNSVHVFQ